MTNFSTYQLYVSRALAGDRNSFAEIGDWTIRDSYAVPIRALGRGVGACSIPAAVPGSLLDLDEGAFPPVGEIIPIVRTFGEVMAGPGEQLRNGRRAGRLHLRDLLICCAHGIR
ncbi:hypothetical protein AU189_03660 [Mycolicibacterium acapulense]|nr:hypothetical protein AU189_03660 [Mycolicibacterium acapulense]